MKILALHANYRTLGGEDVSHQTEVNYLTALGHDVIDVRERNADLARKTRLAQAHSTVYSRAVADRVREELRRSRPDVAYVNNTFPALSPSVYRPLKSAGIPVVAVIRNYRKSCLSANLRTGGESCSRCVGHTLKLPGVLRGCYEGSSSASAVVACTQLLDRVMMRSLDEKMHLIAVSSFVRGSLVAEGFDPRQITVRPNLVWLGQREISRSPKVDRQILFVGRPTEDKGFYLLLAALERLGAKAPRVTVIGDPTTEARRACREKSLAVTFLGLQDHERVASLIAGASAVVVPSVWAEPFGRVVVESLAVGTPVISSDAGGLSEFAGLSPCVVTVPAGEVEPLATALSEISAPSEMLRAACRQRYIERLSPEIWLQGTMDAINAAIRGAI